MFNISLLLLLSFDLLSAEILNIVILADKENAMGNVSASAALSYLDRLTASSKENKVTFLDCTSRNSSDFYDNLSEVYGTLVKASSNPPLVIDLTYRDEISSTLKLFLDTHIVPVVSVLPPKESGDVNTSDWLTEDTFNEHFIQLLHPTHNLLKMVRKIIETNRLQNAAILFGKSFEQVIRWDLLQDIPVRQIYKNIENVISWKNFLAELQDMDIFNYFVLSHYNTIKSTMQFWVQCDPYLSRKLKMFIISQDYKKLKRTCKHLYLIKPEISGEKKVYYIHALSIDENYLDVAVVFYFDLVVKSILAFRAHYSLDKNLLHGEVFDGFSNSSLIYPTNKSGFFSAFIETNKILPLTPFLLNNKNGRGQMDFTMEIQNFDSEKAGEIVQVGSWRPMSEPSDFYFNISTKPIYKIVTLVMEPFIYRKVDENGTEHYKGFCIDMIEEISKMLGFDYEIYMAPDNLFGAPDERGRWTGMIQELISKRADIGLSGMSGSAEREVVVDFTIPFFDMVGMSILMKKFDQKPNQFKFITAMEESVWIWSVAIYLTASFLLWIFSRFSPSDEFNPNYDESTETDLEPLTLLSCLWFCVSSHCNETNRRFPSTLPGYLTLGTWWLFCTVLLTSYTANLAAYLTVARMDTQIQSLDDLASQSGVQYAVIVNSSNMNYFQRMASIEERFHNIWKDLIVNEGFSREERARFGFGHYPVSNKFTKLWSAMQRTGLPTTVEEATERVLASKSTTQGFAYLGDSSITQYVCLTSCEFTQIHTGTGKLPFAIALQKDSPLKNLFNRAILQLHDSRKLVKLKEVWYDENPYRKVCDTSKSKTENGVYLSDIGAVYIFVVFGLFLTCFILILERESMSRKSTGHNKLRKRIIEDMKPYVEHPIDIPFTN